MHSPVVVVERHQRSYTICKQSWQKIPNILPPPRAIFFYLQAFAQHGNVHGFVLMPAISLHPISPTSRIASWEHSFGVKTSIVQFLCTKSYQLDASFKALLHLHVCARRTIALNRRYYAQNNSTEHYRKATRVFIEGHSNVLTND